MDRPYGVLFMSRRNSARSLMAEAVVNRHGNDRFRAFSAAVEPASDIDPIARDVLEEGGYRSDGLRPKHWREFTQPGGPLVDFVFTLSDTASREAFPPWPGKLVASHWRYPDPTKAPGNEWQRRRAYVRTISALEQQMRVFMQLPLASLDAIALQKHLDEIGTEQEAAQPVGMR